MLDDEKYIGFCIELARNAEGRTAPNPMVGSLVVADDGTILGEGFHAQAGLAHAEVEALNQAGDNAIGATLYVSLEPCCHHGKTPPCTERVIASGVRRVVIGLQDPNPKVSGGGISALKEAGINVVSGVMESECRYLNRAFLKWITTGLPWVCLKMAATLDGKIADRQGKSKWITGPQARLYVHELRDTVDCIMVGGATASQDDAQLTVRNVAQGRDPVRVVIDTQLKLPTDSKLATNSDGKTWVFSKEEQIEAKHGQYGPQVRLIPTPASALGEGLDLVWILRYLGQENILSLICEGGGRLASSLLPQTDEIFWFIAPKIMNDSEAVPVLASCGFSSVHLPSPFHTRSVKQLGEDTLIHLSRNI